MFDVNRKSIALEQAELSTMGNHYLHLTKPVCYCSRFFRVDPQYSSTNASDYHQGMR